jgi:hypothetical protein
LRNGRTWTDQAWVQTILASGGTTAANRRSRSRLGTKECGTVPGTGCAALRNLMSMVELTARAMVSPIAMTISVVVTAIVMVMIVIVEDEGSGERKEIKANEKTVWPPPPGGCRSNPSRAPTVVVIVVVIIGWCSRWCVDSLRSCRIRLYISRGSRRGYGL